MITLTEVFSRETHQAGPSPTVLRGSIDVIYALAPEWRALCDEGTHNQPFYRPEWIAAYLRAFEPDATVALVTARRNGRLRGVLPLIEERLGRLGVGATRLRAPVNEHSNRFDLIHGAGDGDLAVDEIWTALARWPGWDVLDIRDVPDDGALLRLLALAGRAGYASATRETLRSPYIPLDGGDHPDVVLGPLDADFRRKVRSGRKKLDALGPVRLARLDDADPATLARFFAIERAGWKGRTGTAISCQPNTRRFYSEVAAGAARHDYLSLYQLTCGEEPVAINLGFTLGSRFFVPKVANVEAFRAVGPGHVMVAEIAREVAGRGIAEFDMLGHDEPYKRRWTPRYRQHFHLHVFRSGAAGGAFQTWTEHVMPAGRRVHRGIHQWTAASRARETAAPRGGTQEQRPWS